MSGVAAAEAKVAPAIRDAATVILLRFGPTGPEVLMGQRGEKAVFMPSHYVFPGGAVDRDDLALADALRSPPPSDERLRVDAEPGCARALGLAAVRELWEEAGLALGRPDPAAAPMSVEVGSGWREFLAAGLMPRTEALRFVFRAVTPPGRPRRFDARFFLAQASDLVGGAEDFARADAELSHLHWVALRAARRLVLPFITGVVLSELEAMLADPSEERPVPYFHHDEQGSHFRLLQRRA